MWCLSWDWGGVNRTAHSLWWVTLNIELFTSSGSPLIDPRLTPVQEFVDTFCEKVELLCPHSFIATEQASFYAARKATLKTGEFLVTADFSENYSFVLQDAAQQFHSSNLAPLCRLLPWFRRGMPSKLCGDFRMNAPRYCSCPPYSKRFHYLSKRVTAS